MGFPVRIRSVARVRRREAMKPVTMNAQDVLMGIHEIPSMLANMRANEEQRQQEHADNEARRDREHKERLQTLDGVIAEGRKKIKTIAKGEPGKPGKDAEPVDLSALEQSILKHIRQPEDGKTPTVDYDRIIRQLLLRVPKPKPGEVTKPEDVIEALKNLPVGKRLSAEHIDGFEGYVKKFWDRYPRGYLHGSGVTQVIAGTGITVTKDSNNNPIITATGSGTTILPTTGTVNDTDTVFPFTEEPTLININGADYLPTGGAITWTWSAITLSATLSSPVGTGGSIFGKL